MNTEPFEFRGPGGQMLAACLDRPDGEVRAHALFAHCFTCGKDFVAASRLANALAGHGIATVRIDFTGLGDSEGEFADTNFSSNIADLVAAADHMRRALQPPALLIGHSLGGAAVLATAAKIPEVRAVATVAAPSDPAHVTGLFERSADEIRTSGQARVQLAGRPFVISRQFLADVAGHNLLRDVATLGRPLLVMHSANDSVVPIDNATRIFATAEHPKSFVSLGDAGHLLPRNADVIHAANVIAAWSARYFDGGD